MTESNAICAYKEGDLVFAKVRGHPQWPARISDIIRYGNRYGNKYGIVFFGTDETAILSNNYIIPYNEENKSKYGNKRQKMHCEGMLEIEKQKSNIDSQDSATSSSENPKADNEGNTICAYKKGDLVFAKVRGHPQWPARISDIVTKCNNIRYGIVFFGTDETANLPNNSIIPYNEENKSKYGNKKQKMHFEGMLQIEKQKSSLDYQDCPISSIEHPKAHINHRQNSLQVNNIKRIFVALTPLKQSQIINKCNIFLARTEIPTRNRIILTDAHDTTEIPYLKETFVYMKNTELTQYNRTYQSPQIAWRQKLVGWIRDVAAKFKIGQASVHLAIKLLDMFMSDHNINTNRLYFVCVGCLRLASKFDETSDKVPTVKIISKELPQECQSEFYRSEYINLERMILQNSSWSVYIPTAKHFVDMLMPISGRSVNTGYDEKTFKYFISYYLDLSLIEVNLLRKLPSRIASAVVYCSRKKFRFYPFWNEELEVLSGLMTTDFEDCVTILSNAYESAVQEAKKTTPCLKRSYDEELKLEAPSKIRKFSIQNGSYTKICTSPLVISTKNKVRRNHVPIVDISPDDGYSTKSCSSAEAKGDDDDHDRKKNSTRKSKRNSKYFGPFWKNP